IGLVPEPLRGRDDLEFDDLRAEVEQVTGTRVTEVNWFSAYRVHHRVADHFRRGRVFLAGDAGHVHSPAGGQGMNTGIGDAVNLAWKLAAVLAGRAAPACSTPTRRSASRSPGPWSQRPTGSSRPSSARAS